MTDNLPTIALIHQQLREEFGRLSSKDETWKYLLDIARKHQGMEASLKQEKFLIEGCATRLFLVPRLENGRVFFETDTDEGEMAPMIVRGLAALAQRVYSNQPPEDILTADPKFFQQIGLNVALSPTRVNGFGSLLKQIYLYATVYKSLKERGLQNSNSPV